MLTMYSLGGSCRGGEQNESWEDYRAGEVDEGDAGQERRNQEKWHEADAWWKFVIIYREKVVQHKA